MIERPITAADFRVEDSLGYLLKRAQRASFQLAEQAFRAEALSFVQWVALMQLRDGLVDTAGGLARCMGHDSGAMTRMLDQLEARGLIARERSRADRRVVHLRLTDEGASAANALIPRIAALWETLLDDFAPDEITLLRVMLQRLIQRIDTVTDMGAEA